MGLFSKDIKTMDDLFVHTSARHVLRRAANPQALPGMIAKATDAQLKQTFQTHLGETKNQVTRLEQVFKMHGADAKGIDCPAIDGIIEEAEEVAGEIDDKAVLNAALASAAQAVEHYEIARYGTLVAWAKELGRNDCASVLQKNWTRRKRRTASLPRSRKRGSISRPRASEGRVQAAGHRTCRLRHPRIIGDGGWAEEEASRPSAFSGELPR